MDMPREEEGRGTSFALFKDSGMDTSIRAKGQSELEIVHAGRYR